MLKFLLPLTFNIINFFTPIIFTLSLLGVLYNTFIIIRLIDFKKIIAYSSVIHMNILVIGLFSFNLEGLGGSIFMMLNHGIVSAGLFLLVGTLYDRYHSRLIFYYKGLNKYMPLYNIVFILLTLANIGLPCTSSFVVELLIFLGIYNISSVITLFVCTSCIFSAIYGL
jgi:NADH-quinone oxidoreductase subunit M